MKPEKIDCTGKLQVILQNQLPLLSCDSNIKFNVQEMEKKNFILVERGSH